MRLFSGSGGALIKFPFFTFHRKERKKGEKKEKRGREGGERLRKRSRKKRGVTVIESEGARSVNYSHQQVTATSDITFRMHQLNAVGR
jgi:hypothetical protein